jgi:hypothetical protein
VWLISRAKNAAYGFLCARNADNASVGKPETKRPAEKIRHRWEDNTEIDMKEIVWVVDWIRSEGMLF